MSDDNHSVNSGMLASMNQHQGGGGGHPTGSMFDQNIVNDAVKIIGGVGEKSLDLGLTGSVDSLFTIPSAFDKNPIQDVATGTLVGKEDSKMAILSDVAGGITHELKNTSLENVAFDKQANLPQQVGAPIPDKGGQQSQGH